MEDQITMVQDKNQIAKVPCYFSSMIFLCIFSFILYHLVLVLEKEDLTALDLPRRKFVIHSGILQSGGRKKKITELWLSGIS